MNSPHQNQPPTILADVRTLQQDLERLCSTLKVKLGQDCDQEVMPQADAIVVKGK